MTAVGPVGKGGGLSWLVVLGASGRSAGGVAGVGDAGVWDAGVGDAGAGAAGVCAAEEIALKARTRARERSIMRCLTPTYRLSQTRCWSNVTRAVVLTAMAL